jgi:hypothetical protein
MQESTIGLILTPEQYMVKSFREFLFIRYAYLKAALPKGFSYRDFSRRAGFGSPNYLKLVMDGDRNLAPESFYKFMSGLYVSEMDEAFVRALYLADIVDRIELKGMEAA